MKNHLFYFFVIISLTAFGQDSIYKLEPFEENHRSFGDFNITEIKVGDTIAKVEYHFIKDAWLPNGTQIIKDGFGYREYFDGVYIRRYHYQFGDANGPFFFYDSIGKIVKSGNCTNGDIDGNFYEYYPNGQISMLEIRDKGKWIQTQFFYDDGSFKSLINYNENGHKHGKYVEYYENGSIKITGQFKPEDSCKFIDIDSLSKEMEPDPMTNGYGIKTGEWIEYFPSGKIQKIEVFCGCYWHYEKEIIENKAWYAHIKKPCNCSETLEYDEKGTIINRISYSDCIINGK